MHLSIRHYPHPDPIKGEGRKKGTSFLALTNNYYGFIVARQQGGGTEI